MLGLNTIPKIKVFWKKKGLGINDSPNNDSVLDFVKNQVQRAITGS